MFVFNIIGNVIAFFIKLALLIAIIVYGGLYLLTDGFTNYSIAPDQKTTVVVKPNTAEGLIIPTYDPRFANDH